jgi:Tol biopolymer transport system component
MRYYLRFAAHALTLGPSLILLACGGDDLVSPTAGNIAITTTTTGTEPDTDGYLVSVNDGAEVSIGANGTHQVTDLTAGNHTVRLGGIAANCQLAGENPRTVSVEAGATATVQLNVTCGPTTGSMTITASTTGVSPDPDGYTVTLDGADRGALGASGNITIDALAAGDHVVGLSGIAANCQVAGENPRGITVTAGASATAVFTVSCIAPPPVTGGLRVATTTTGDSPDPDGYAFAVDGGASQPVGTSAAATVAGLATGSHTVTLSGLASNCTVQGTNPRAVTVAAGATAEVAFEVACTAATGSLRITTTTTGDSPDPDGYTASVDGGASQPIEASGTLTISGLNPGSHQVKLGGLASNCTVSGNNPRSATVNAGGSVEISFEVTCPTPGTTGSIEITTATTGASLDDGYIFAVDNRTAQAIGPNNTVTVPDVSAGPHQVKLDGIAPNCTVTGENPLSVSVAAGMKSTVRFDISCQVSQPSSGKIAFLSARDNPPDDGWNDLYVMNPDGSGVQRLTVGSDVLSFDWAPDGSKIVFESFRDEEIYAINVDGTGLINLTNTPGTREQAPDWSPDGSRIAFLRGDDIYVMNTNGGDVRQAVNGASLWDWSPGGQRIAFLGQDNLGRQRDYYIINVDGTGEVRLTNTPLDNKQDQPYWSPDGRSIAFTASPPNVFGEIYVINPDGSNQQRLTNNAANDNTPKWSPNSTRIAFLTDRDRGQRFDSREIYIMNADGSGQTNLTNTPGQDPAPWEADESLTGWSPNGSKMVYERNGRIWVMNSDGSGQTDLNQVGNSSAWSPR